MAEARVQDSSTFSEKYGPWAVIAGASEGMGADYARLLAQQGINCVLVARRQEVLEQLAAELRQEFGVQTRVITLDLSAIGAANSLFERTADLEVGLYISNAGADPRGKYFLDGGIEDWLTLLQRNTASVMEACHRYGASMKERGRGGIIIMSSGAGLGGGSRIAVYAATKAFEIAFAESLWSELGPLGIDVLCLVTPGTDTPALRRILARKNLQVEGLYSSAEVASTGLRELGNGPTYVFSFGSHITPEAAAALRAERKARVISSSQGSAMFFGDT